MSISGVIFLCLSVAALLINMAAYVFVPEKNLVNLFDIAGWTLAVAAIICWEFGKG